MKWVINLFGRDVTAPDDAPQSLGLIGGSARDAHLDSYSSTWAFVSQWAEAELIKARESNDSLKKDESATAALRGKIAILKELINLPTPRERKHRQVDDTEFNDY